MILRQPKFWFDQNHPLGVALTPLSWLWVAGSKLRAVVTKPYVAPLTVICVGNITVGGAGKTPAAIAIAGHLTGKKIAFLMRGYGGRQKHPILISHATDATQYGDEAVLLSRHAPVIVARNRVAGLKMAVQQGFEIVIADDGFQNPSFAKTKSLLVIDGVRGLGNGRVIPAGPLRETVPNAAARASAILIVGDDTHHVASLFPGRPILRGDIIPAAGGPDKSVPYVAFAGIGYPDKFFTTLGDAGYVLAETVSFPDHHPYDDTDINRLRRLARAHNAPLVTTEKDLARLPDAPDIVALPVTMNITGDLGGFLT